MKKLLSITVVAIVASVLSSSSALAKTEGSYLGFDLLETKTTFYSKAIYSDGTIENFKPSFSGRTYGLGLNYKYAFNFNNFFVAPGIILEQNSLGSSKAKADYSQSLQIKNRYGVKADFGYDLTDRVSPYLTLGYAEIAYKAKSAAYSGGSIVNGNKSAYEGDWFYGAGVKFDLTKNVALNLEYNLQNFQAKTQVPSQASYLNKISYISKLDVLKLGLAYNF
jgi:outer membrane autotransporter protein